MEDRALDSFRFFTKKPLSRREFLKLGVEGGLGLAFLSFLKACNIPNSPASTPIVSPAAWATATPVPGVDIDMKLFDAKRPDATREQIDFLRNNGREPVEMILEKLQGSVSVVGLGEMHNELDMEQFANRVIGAAAERKLIQFVALEIDNSEQGQGQVDEFLRRGTISPELQKILNQHNTVYLSILETARNNQLPILCVDNHGSNDRDDFMSRRILSNLEAHPADKCIFYGGNGHMIERYDLLAGTLKDKYYSVFQLNDRNIGTGETVYNAMIQAGIKEAIGIDNVKQTPFSTATYGHPYELWSEYGRITDAIVLLPPKK
ncbi:hypothetical protein HY407_00670 [Candidatus Gottesmanbacteria bacterium]|nr:hypothetical protein [Candidatus Gottesmanbacteria bacterium]